MRIPLLVGLIFFVVGCSGVRRINTEVHIPELDKSGYNDSYYVEAWKDLRVGKPDIAFKKFKLSVSEDEKLYVGFGYVFWSKNKLNLAKRNFEKALELNPDSLYAELGLAGIYEFLEDMDLAFRSYSKLLVKYPENARIKLRYEFIKSTQTEYYLKKADEYKMENKEDNYINALEMAAKYSPEIIDIKIKIADFYNNRNQFEKSTFYYEEVLRKLPNKKEILVKLADIYEKINKLDSAVYIYNKLCELEPGNIDLINKINELKIKFYELDLPTKFKNIFFKDLLNREDLAALIGHYFKRYLIEKPPMIITDIASSFANEYITKICALGIMNVRPDHSFKRFLTVTRAEFAVIFDSLIKYLESTGLQIQYTPLENIREPLDISPLHKNYRIIKFLVNSQIMKLDSEDNFNPTLDMYPSEVLDAIKKILITIRDIEE